MLPFLRRISIENYKSIARCQVDLGPLTFLVGPNGSGKSNFLDALRFVADSLNTTLEHALRDRGGIQSVRRRSHGHPTHFGIRLDLVLGRDTKARYAFKVAAEKALSFYVQREECYVHSGGTRGDGPDVHHFEIVDGAVSASSVTPAPAVERDRLGLVAFSGRPEFRAVYDGLRHMGFYNLNPDRIRDLQEPDPGQILARDGRNLAAVLREMERFDSGRVLHDVVAHLQAVVPDVTSVSHKPLGPKETLEFQQQTAGDAKSRSFLAADMSDGTLRSLGILVAAFQSRLNGGRRVTFVGIEEPEVALHPGATEVITEVLLLASQEVQVVATTHSPEILNHKAIRAEHLLAVSVRGGDTVIGPVDEAARGVLNDRLYAPGELLSAGPLEPDSDKVEEARRQLQLFGTGGE